MSLTKHSGLPGARETHTADVDSCGQTGSAALENKVSVSTA